MSDAENTPDTLVPRVLDRETADLLRKQYSSLPSTASTAAFESFVQSTLSDLQARSQVESTINDLVRDVEFAIQLQDRLSVETHQHKAERIIAEQELALQENHVAQKETRKSHTLMADALVQDLWVLSKEVGSLLSLKQKHEAMIQEYDELTRKLAQAEDDLHKAQSRPPPQQPQQQKQQQRIQQQSPPTAPAPAPPQQQSAPKPAAVEPPPSQSSATIVKIPVKASAAADAPTKTTIVSTTMEPAATMVEIPPPKQEASSNKKVVEGEKSSTAPVVALVEDDGGDNESTSLENIEMEILMRIFGFLDPYDILNTAQVNISMYSRIDSLFGFGMETAAGPADDAASTTSTIATTPTVAAATQKTATSTTTISTTKPPPPPKATPAAKQQEPQFGHRLVGGGRNLLSILQGGVGNKNNNANKDANSTTGESWKTQESPKRLIGGAVAAAAAAVKPRAGSSNAGDSKPPLSEAMAHSMAAKLNDSEINAIISMTEKLRSKEKQVGLLIREKEELEGKLSGSEAVKGFLITKVRDMEKILNKSDETEKKVTQQIASDQEVIAFLDGRVQELERLTRVIQKEKNAVQEKLKSVVAQNDKKVAVLSDMLQFERQKLKENEREWKATKKLLVKEVKGCRAQIVALQAERDGFREQNDSLRKAVMAGGSSSNGGRSSSPYR